MQTAAQQIAAERDFSTRIQRGRNLCSCQVAMRLCRETAELR